MRKMISSSGGPDHRSCINDQGLAMVSFSAHNSVMSEEYRTPTQENKYADGCRKHSMLNHKTVQEAANYMADNVIGSEDGAHTAIISEQYGIGAVVVLNNKVIGRGKPETHFGKYTTRHAEIMAIDAVRKTEYYSEKNRRKMILVTTLEPCPLCYYTTLLEGIGVIVYGLADKLSGRI